MRSANYTTTGAQSFFVLSPSMGSPFNVTLAVLLTNSGSPTGVTATGGTYTVEYTHNDLSTALQPGTTLAWFRHPFMSPTVGSGVGNQDGNLAFPCTAVRLTVNTLPTGGTAPGFMFIANQAGQAG